MEYIWDILLISISRGASNCVQRVFEKKTRISLWYVPHFKFLLSNERLDFCDKKKQIKRINNAD